MAVSEYSAGVFRKGDKIRRTQTPAETVQALWEGFVRVESGAVPAEATPVQASSRPAPSTFEELNSEPEDDQDDEPTEE